jgi:hypothetical protein
VASRANFTFTFTFLRILRPWLSVLLYDVALQVYVCVCIMYLYMYVRMCVCMFSWHLSIDGYMDLSKIHYKVRKDIKDEQEQPGLR